MNNAHVTMRSDEAVRRSVSVTTRKWEWHDKTKIVDFRSDKAYDCEAKGKELFMWFRCSGTRLTDSSHSYDFTVDVACIFPYSHALQNRLGSDAQWNAQPWVANAYKKMREVTEAFFLDFLPLNTPGFTKLGMAYTSTNFTKEFLQYLALQK